MDLSHYSSVVKMIKIIFLGENIFSIFHKVFIAVILSGIFISGAAGDDLRLDRWNINLTREQRTSSFGFVLPRKPKLFYISTTSTTTILSTTTVCFVSNTTPVVCPAGKRKRKALTEPRLDEDDINPTSVTDLQPHLQSGESRSGRLAIYWKTTTLTSTSTTFTTSSTLASLSCTPSGFVFSLCGWEISDLPIPSHFGLRYSRWWNI